MKYRVNIRQNMYRDGAIEVEAESREDASRIFHDGAVINIIHGTPIKGVTWDDPDEGQDLSDIYVINVEEVR